MLTHHVAVVISLRHLDVANAIDDVALGSVVKRSNELPTVYKRFSLSLDQNETKGVLIAVFIGEITELFADLFVVKLTAVLRALVLDRRDFFPQALHISFINRISHRTTSIVYWAPLPPGIT